MKKITFIIVLSVLISACNSTKKVQKSISSGNYDRAIEISVKKLRKNKTSKKAQKHILLLEESYQKIVAQDLRNLERLKKDTNPASIEQIFETYQALDKRQEFIRPLLPLFHKKEDRNIAFDFSNYTDELNASRATLSDFLYANAKKSLTKLTKQDARKAYANLEYLDKINPNFKDVDVLLKEAHYKGTNFVWVTLENQTNQVIPRRLEDDLLNFNTYGLNEFWTEFHNQKDDKTDYSYQLKMLFHRIDVSPEILNEKQYLLEREVKDGFEYQLDANGNVLRDSLGNGIKIDKFIKISSDFIEVHQEKACRIAGDVVLLKTGIETNVIERFPIESEFVFIHDFGEMSGDKRALDDIHLDLIQKREIPFPTSEQMIFDTGEDLKQKLKAIIEDFEL